MPAIGQTPSLATAPAEPQGFSLTGVVVDGKTHLPIPGANVYAPVKTKDACAQGAPAAITSASGQFTLTNLDPGPQTVSVYANGGSVAGTVQVDPSKSAGGVTIEAGAMPPVLMPGATVGRPYLYGMTVNLAGAYYRQIGKVSNWNVSEDGVVTAIPDAASPPQITLDIQACVAGQTPLRRLFVASVATCAAAPAGALSWCDAAPPAVNSGPTTIRFSDQAYTPGAPPNFDGPRIVQFSRVQGDDGVFGGLAAGRSQVSPNLPAHLVAPALVNAVNASKPELSGSVLVAAVSTCPEYQWKVVTQSVDSSNILVYAPGDINAFCNGNTLRIVLPVHAVWATAVGYQANTFDPSWRPVGPVPAARECDGGYVLTPAAIPWQGIRPCDDMPQRAKPGPIYWHPLGWTYLRLTQPGSTQGGISLAPFGVHTSPKVTWDSQAYVSTRLGPGWAGLTAAYEYDHKAVDNFNSATAALTYDWRFAQTQRPVKLIPAPTYSGKDADPFLGLRAPELTVRFGPEWSPGPAPVRHSPDLRRSLNMVGAATLRVPFVLNGPPTWVFNRQMQPSMFSVLPLVGVEEGFRYIWHDVAGVRERPEIRRYVGGVDASMRLPYNFTHNVLGDRPITLDYSLRYRFLAHDEPYIDPWTQMEKLSGDWRTYGRIALIMPLSPYLQVRGVLQMGTLPPLFQNVERLFTLGITFSNPGSSEH